MLFFCRTPERRGYDTHLRKVGYAYPFVLISYASATAERRIYREQIVDVDDHKSEAVEGGFLLHQFVLIGQPAGIDVLTVATRTRPPDRRAVHRWRRRRRPAVQTVNVEQRRSEADRQVACRHLQQSIHVYLHQETNHITQARQKSWTERSMNDAHNCPKNLTKIHIQIT